ncbi:hypothetical protein l13_11940 [Neisseria weaveri ATCC 51223]|nr:hypothetical protein l13_11940 [Neisseria weaveri ATCC 51223]
MGLYKSKNIQKNSRQSYVNRHSYFHIDVNALSVQHVQPKMQAVNSM